MQAASKPKSRKREETKVFFMLLVFVLDNCLTVRMSNIGKKFQYRRLGYCKNVFFCVKNKNSVLFICIVFKFGVYLYKLLIITKAKHHEQTTTKAAKGVPIR